MIMLKRVLAVLLVLAIFVGSFIGSFTLFNNGTDAFDSHLLTVFDDNTDCFYLKKAAKDIKFRVESRSDTEPEYTVTDSDGNVVMNDLHQVRNGVFYICAPAGGYTEGAEYTLTLSENCSFTDENLKEARILVFTIERAEIAEYTFTDQVVEVPDTISIIDEHTISVDTDGLQSGDIVFGQSEEGEYIAYKISELVDDGSATVTIPAADEIYEDLNVYGEFFFDVKDIAANPDLEMEIIENVRQSNFYSSLLVVAYADEFEKDGDIDVSVKPNDANHSLDIEIKITLKGGQNGLFDQEALKYHDVVIRLLCCLKNFRVHTDVPNLLNWDIATMVDFDYQWQVSITRNFEDLRVDNDYGLEELFKEKDEYSSYDEYYIRHEYQKQVKKITEALNKVASDASAGELKIFDWKLPLPTVPGLYFSAEVKLFVKFEVTASLTISQEGDGCYTVGTRFKNFAFTRYSNLFTQGGDISLSLRGKAEAKTGVKLVVKATLVNDKVAHIKLEPEVGLYADIYAAIPILGQDEASSDKWWYGYFEPGVYFGASISGYVNLVLGHYDCKLEILEKKFPIEAWTLGNNKIATGIMANAQNVRAVDNRVDVPDILFEYYDVEKGMQATETLPVSDLKFVSTEGDQLEVEDGKIILPEVTSSGSCYVTATYRHTDGITYSTVFRVLISGSMLEGKVSAYTDDLTTGALEDARVEVYTATNSTSPISTQTTDADGKFSFNIAEGTYRLVISADGYRTLTSTQQVAEDEIKYTEHILLMDNQQTGYGSAGGTVTNALDGRGVSGVQLRLRNDWNNTSGPVVEGFATQTNSDGQYSVSGVPVGYYTVEASIGGYVTGFSNIIVLSDNPKTDFDFTITPELNADEIRIVLSWGSTPSDLDSHLIGRTPSDDTFNVYYSDKEYHYDGVEMANLDVDDTSSYGPETVTILQRIHGTYTYAVHDYSNKGSSSSTAMSYSGAVVKIYMGSTKIAEYHVPTDQVGTYWTVFQINSAGKITPINSLSNTKPAA